MGRRPLGLFLWSAGAAAGTPWPEAPGRPPAEDHEELSFGEGIAARYASALEANAALATRAAARGLSEPAKLPARVFPERTQHGEGHFAIIGDWGNPFHPGTNDSAEAYWGPHWKCNTEQGDPVRCRRGSPEWQRDEFAQVNVARALAAYSRRNEVQFVINVGDNLYPSGFDSPSDPRWQYVFEDRYADESLQVPWLSVLGNHDWGGFDCYLRNGRLYRADAQIDYDTEHDWRWPQNKTSRWVMPHWYYKRRISFGNTTVDIFAIGTHWAHEAEVCGEIKYAQKRCDASHCRATLRRMADECWQFLETELPASDADWKFVVGHRPLESLGRWMSPSMNFVDLLWRTDVSMYIAGHRHTMEEHWVTPSDKVPFFRDGGKRPGAILEVVSGAGGGAYSDGEVQGMSRWGFNGVKMTKTSLRVDYVSDHGALLRAVHVGPPCAQLRGAACAWAVGSWSPAAPCCAGAFTGGCTSGLRTRKVWCTAGSESHCEGSPRPNSTEFCEPVATTTMLRSSTTTASSLAPSKAAIAGASELPPGEDPAEEPRHSDQRLPDGGEPKSATVLSHWALTGIILAIAALVVGFGTLMARRWRTGRLGRSDADGSRGAMSPYNGPQQAGPAVVATYTGPRQGDPRTGGVAALPAGPTLLPRPPGARQFPTAPQPDPKSPHKRVADVTELEVSVDAAVEPVHRCRTISGLILGKTFAPPPAPPIPEAPAPLGPCGSPRPSPRLPEEPAVVPQAPHVRRVQSSSMYFETSTRSTSLGSDGNPAEAEEPLGRHEGKAASNAPQADTI